MGKKVLIALPPVMLEQVDFVASCEHRTRSDLIREALRRYLDNFRRTQGLSEQIVAKKPTPVIDFEPPTPTAPPVAPAIVEPILTPTPAPIAACGGTGLEGWTPVLRPVEFEAREPEIEPASEPVDKVVVPLSLADYEAPENVHDWDSFSDARQIGTEYNAGGSRY